MESVSNSMETESLKGETGALKGNVKVERKTPGFRQDVVLWFAGMLFIIALIGAIFGLGHLRGWDAKSAYSNNTSTLERFLPEPLEPEPGVPGRSDPYASSRWYFWQLPPDEATPLTRLFVWMCYIGHQLTIWATIYYAQKKKASGKFPGPKYSSQINVIQWVPLVFNMFFHLMHLAQTHITYDGLAQDVSEASSQGSIIVVLVLILLMESRDRGVAFGWPTAEHKDKVSLKLRFTQGPVNLVRKYHGYGFAWGVIFTYWYHPMENTWGHALGFLHTWMILLQGSLMYTKVHLNRLWRLTLEAWLIIHSTVIAMQTGGPRLDGTSLWPFFCFGTLWIFTMTQIFSFEFCRKFPWWIRVVPFLVYMGIVVWCYSWIPDANGNYFVRMPQEIVMIPLLEYGCLIYAWFVIEIFQRIEKKISTSNPDDVTPMSPGRETLHILCFILIYVVLIVISYLVQELDWKQNLTLIMVILMLVVIFFVCVSFFVMKPIFKGINVDYPRKKDVISGGSSTASYGSLDTGTNVWTSTGNKGLKEESI